MPRCSSPPTSGTAVGFHGISEQREDVGGVLRREVLNPAEERRVPHFGTDEDDRIEREEHRHLDEHRPAADSGLIFSRLELHHGLLLGRPVVLDALQRLHSGCTRRIAAIEAKERLASGKNSALTITVTASMASPKLPSSPLRKRMR